MLALVVRSPDFAEDREVVSIWRSWCGQQVADAELVAVQLRAVEQSIARVKGGRNRFFALDVLIAAVARAAESNRGQRQCVVVGCGRCRFGLIRPHYAMSRHVNRLAIGCGRFDSVTDGDDVGTAARCSAIRLAGSDARREGFDRIDVGLGVG